MQGLINLIIHVLLKIMVLKEENKAIHVKWILYLALFP